MDVRALVPRWRDLQAEEMILLDTHAILWLLGGHRRAESLIASGEVELRAYQRGRASAVADRGLQSLPDGIAHSRSREEKQGLLHRGLIPLRNENDTPTASVGSGCLARTGRSIGRSTDLRSGHYTSSSGQGVGDGLPAARLIALAIL